MRNKGLVLFFTILIALTCLYCLSFSFVTWKVEKSAKAYANEAEFVAEVEKDATNAARADEMLKKRLIDSAINVREREYLNRMKDSTIFLGFTYKECKYKEINLGLDLKGGMNATLAIATPDVVKNLASDPTDTLFLATFEKAMTEYGKGHTGEDFIDLFAETFAVEKGIQNKNNTAMVLFFSDKMKNNNAKDEEVVAFLKEKRDEILDQTFRILRTRIDRFGVAQPNLEKLQGGRILVELPGIKEKERVEDLLKSTAMLEFWEVYTNYQGNQNITPVLFAEAARNAARYVESSADSALLCNVMGKSVGADGLAIGYFAEVDTGAIGRLLPMIVENFEADDVVFFWGIADKKQSNAYPLIPLKKASENIGAVLNGKTINGQRIVRSARQDVDEHNRVIVSMSMEDAAAKEWQRITADAIKKRNESNIPTNIAIVLDRIVYSYPTIQSEIANGESMISGNFSIDEAKDLATVLNSGNLEVGLDIVASEVVGPTLGQKSVNAGLFSFLIAFLLVLIYMYLYYNRAGLVADIALLTNVFFILGVLASLGAVLTLPGIAGIVLTLGMAVDANVLIYERIREEVRLGKGVRLAVEEGYQNAYSAIIDGNVTTLITGIVLYILGSGPVQGFATTLIIGILSSLFTAIFISRIIFERRLSKGKELVFGNKFTNNTFANAKYDFLSAKKICYIISGSLIGVMIISFCTLGLNPGIDFTGGRNYVVLFDQDVDASAASEAIANEFEGTPQVKTFGSNNQLRITVNYKVDDNSSEAEAECNQKLFTALKGFYKSDVTYKDFAEPVVNEAGIQSYQKVQSTIAKELLAKTIWAVVIALILIFIYIAFRFKNWQYGLGGVVTLVHDSLLTIGLFSLFYKVCPFSMEVDQSFIAAILTVIGYSINNVVIIYDRIRENITNTPKADRYTLFNAAVNSTLGRTLNTCGTTILVLLVIFIFGGEVIRGFIFAMGAGILIGTYSGIFIATPLAFDLLNKAKKKVNVAKIDLSK